MATKQRLAQALCVVALLATPISGFSDDSAIERELDLIKEQNRVLQDQVKKLTDKVAALEETKESSNASNADSSQTNHTVLPKMKLGVQGGLGWQISSFNRNAPFFLDDIKVSLEAQLSKHISFYSDVNLSTGTRYFGGTTGTPVFAGTSRPGLGLNEIYLDFHNLLERWNHDELLNVRAGEFYTPFGEYQENRYPFDNPLVTHSLPDIWGLTPGLELYGKWEKFSYAVAAQDRNQSFFGNGNPDKLVSGRIGYQVTDNLDLSLSALRTGDLQPGEASSIFMHDAVFAGPPPYAYTFIFFDGNIYAIAVPVTGATHAEIGELDARYKWKSGYIKGWGGVAFTGSDYQAEGFLPVHSDNESWYYGLELSQDITPRIYVAARAGQVLDTIDSLRLSAGIGYRFNSHVVLKTDFTYDESPTFGYFGDVKQYIKAFSGELAFRF